MEVNTSMCALVIHHSLVVLGRLRVYHNKLVLFVWYVFWFVFIWFVLVCLNWAPLLANYLLYFAQDIPPTACMGSRRWSVVLYH